MKLLSPFLALLLVCPARLFAQTSTGQITGTVFDSTGAVIPGARVDLIGADTSDLVRSMTTNAFGAFSAPLLRPGNYIVEVTMQGFKKLVRSDITLRVDDVLSLRLTLEPGTATESITVAASAEMLEQRTSSMGQVVQERTIQQLPLNGRNYLQLGLLSAGAVQSDRSRDRSFSAYGNRGLQNAFLLDGARNQNYLRGLDNRQRDAMRPSLEAIAEFKVQTSNFSAEYGASAGAVVNVVTKSGTNEIHGSAFEFLRNNAFDARDFFLPAERDQPLFIQHQFGGSLGGPFVKNRAWWHVAFQRTHISEGDNFNSTVPLPEHLNGNFGSTPVFDPFTTRPNPAGAGFVRDVFPNNIIPASRFDPTGKALADRYPAPTRPGTALNFINNPVHATRANNMTSRGDLRITDNDTLFGRFSFDRGNFLRQPALPEPAHTGTRRETPSYSVGVGYTRIISPTVINEFRFAWNRAAVDQDGTLPLDPIIPGSLAEGVNSSIPTFNLTGFSGLGAQPPGFGNIPLVKSSGVWNLSNNFSANRGKHTLKAGFDYQLLRITTSATLQGRGSFTFNGVFSQNPQRRPGSGSPVADLLLGLPHQVVLGTRSVSAERAHNLYWYFQDDWAVTPTLTLNLGVRYELTRPFTEVENRMSNLILDPGAPNFGQLVFAGLSGQPRPLQTTDRNNIAPRFGFAWRTPAPGLVVRGGYGIFYGQDEGFGVSQRMTNNPPFVGFGGVTNISDQLNPSSTIPLAGPLPARAPAPTPQEFTLNPLDTAQLRSWAQRFTLPYVQQWNLSIQKELPGEMLWEVNYVGNRGLKLWGAYEGNQPVPGPGAINPRRPFAQYTRAPVIRMEPWVFSSYQGVSTRLEKRFSKGFNFLMAYTFGRSLDTQSNVDLCDGCGASSGAGSVQDTRNRRANYGLSDHHIANRFVVSGLYELPFGKGRSYAASGLASHIFGGWALSGVLSMSDGLPFTLSLPFDNANVGTTNWPNRIRDGRLDNWTIERYFDTDAFVFPPEFTFGNAGRNILVGPGTNNLDFSLQRNFPIPIHEGSRLEFRAEAFNAFNRPHFSNPGAGVGTPGFGQIGSTARTMRQLQFALRLLF
jgi:hypothetical protein